MSSKKNLKAYQTVSKNLIGHDMAINVLGKKKQPWGLLFFFTMVVKQIGNLFTGLNKAG